MRVSIVVAEFNRAITEAMFVSAVDEARLANAEVVSVVRVPGAYETPLMVAALLARADVDAVVVLGFIERGETLHGEVMGHVVHAASLQLSLQHRKPVGLGLIGPGATVAQAEARKDGSARAAVRGALASAAALAAL